VAERLWRGARQLSPGALLLSATMNGFYGLKQLTGNLPAQAPLRAEGTIAHPAAHEAPSRLALPRARRGGGVVEASGGEDHAPGKA
jgi:hypothetical protein